LPAITAGPIERIQNFEKEIIKKTEFFDDVLVGGKRLTLGLVKKFVIADFFFLFSMNKDNIFLVNSKEWLWVLLFSYAWMIYFDFSGYTDVALGLSALLGINLPENFNRPYFSENLTSFWNRWHISLTQWIRAYFYFPLTRFLKSRSPFKSEFLINSFTQICTMVLIGLWHGITLNFFLWGLWHGFGLVINSLWKNWVKKLSFSNINTSYLKNLLSTFSTAFTFLYVCIGWIWFAIPDFQSALKLLAKFIGK